MTILTIPNEVKEDILKGKFSKGYFSGTLFIERFENDQMKISIKENNKTLVSWLTPVFNKGYTLCFDGIKMRTDITIE